MPIISFNIPSDKATRISNALPMHGYVFDAESGISDNQQRLTFLKQKTIEYWASLTQDAEKRLAIQAAEAGATKPDLSDIT